LPDDYEEFQRQMECVEKPKENETIVVYLEDGSL
jgi:hypothetical protein